MWYAFRIRTLTCLLGVAASSMNAAEQPTLQIVLTRVATYLTQYAHELATVVADEEYTQRLTLKSGLHPKGPTSVRLESEFALVRPSDGPFWLGFRDVQRVNGTMVHDRAGRLQEIFFKAPADAFDQARRIANESARYNLGPIYRNINEPTTALMLLDAQNQSRMRFSRDGEEPIGDVRAWIVRVRERSRPTVIRTERGGDVLADGRVWIDPVLGSVLRTELVFLIERWRAWLEVTFRPEPTFGLWVPAQLRERYDLEHLTVTGEATYANYRRFHTGARIVPQ